MTDSKKILNALNKARDLRLKDKTLEVEKEFIVAPQLPIGESAWAKWQKENLIEPYHALWVFKDEKPKIWLAVRIEIPFKDFSFSRRKENQNNIFTFNLQNSEDKRLFYLLEDEFRTFLTK